MKVYQTNEIKNIALLGSAAARLLLPKVWSTKLASSSAAVP